MSSDAQALAAVNFVENHAADTSSWTVIEPSSGWASLKFGELWRYRELLYFLTWRDIKVRYKQTALGALWAILQPLLTMAIFSVVFGHFGKLPSDGVAYPIFVYCALVPWAFFSYALSQSADSLIADAKLISKVYFPRLVIPLAAPLSGLIDLAISFLVLVGMMLFYGRSPSPALLTLPLFVLLAVVAAFAVGLWLSALNVQYRDVRYTIPFLTQIWLFATPVAYSPNMIHGRLHIILALNPMAGVVEGFRWALLGAGRVDVLSLAVSAGVTVLILITGLAYFQRMEHTFADVI